MNYNELINNVIWIAGIIWTLFKIFYPIASKVSLYYASKTHNQRIINLAKRADVIVSSLIPVQADGKTKKDTGINDLIMYASEANIKLNKKQAGQYIENAYQFLNTVTSQLPEEGANDTTKEVTNSK